MSPRGSVASIDEHISVLEGLTIGDEESARAAIPHLMATAAAINVVTAQAPEAGASDPIMGLAFGDDLVDKLKEWVQKLVSKLAELAKTLADGTTFSLTVGSSITLTVNFPSLKTSS